MTQTRKQQASIWTCWRCGQPGDKFSLDRDRLECRYTYGCRHRAKRRQRAHKDNVDQIDSHRRELKMGDNPKNDTVSVTAYWGNDDAESTIELPLSAWAAIQQGGEHTEQAESWYEGTREAVTWSFKRGLVSIEGEDSRQCLVDTPLAELRVD